MPDPVITQADWDAVSQEREPTSTPSPAEQTPLPETPPETVAEASLKEETPPAQEKPADPYAGLSPEVQAKLKQFDDLAAAVPHLVSGLKEATGRIGSLQSQWAKAQQAAEKPSQTAIAAAAKDPEKWSELKSEFPEWGDAISEFVDARVAGLGGAGLSPEQVEQLVVQRSEASTAQLEAKFNRALVTVKHPGWDKDVKTPEFEAWFKVQDAQVQALADSADGFDAIQMLDLFKEHKAKPVQDVRDERQQRLAAAASTPKPAGNGGVVKAFADMTPAEQWDYLAKEREKRQG